MNERLYKNILLFYVIGPFAGLLTAVWLLWNSYVFWTDIAILIGMQFFCTVGIGVGYHRLLTHDGFKTFWPIRAFFIAWGAIAMEGAPLAWAATHVKHHAHSDEEDDPHSPMKSFWHAHMGWLFDSSNFADPKEYTPHLLEDKVVVTINKLYPLWIVLALAIPYLLGGLTGFVWGGVVRVLLTTHITWSVNSICHTFGKREFETTDESRNNWIIGLLAFGEGWHNNHHAFPKNAFHGMRWWQFDLNGIIIRNLERFGLAWDVQRVGQEVLDAHQIRGRTMHENIQEMKRELGEFIDYSREELSAMIQSLPPKQVATVRYAHEKTMKRFAEIQLHMEKRRNMKKAALERRRREVAQLVAIAKQKMEMGVM